MIFKHFNVSNVLVLYIIIKAGRRVEVPYYKSWVEGNNDDFVLLKSAIDFQQIMQINFNTRLILVMFFFIMPYRKTFCWEEMYHSEIPGPRLFPLVRLPASAVVGCLRLVGCEFLRKTSSGGWRRSVFIGQFPSPRFGVPWRMHWRLYLSQIWQCVCQSHSNSKCTPFPGTESYSYSLCDVIGEADDTVRS